MKRNETQRFIIVFNELIKRGEINGIEEQWTLYVHHLFTTNMNDLDEVEGNKTIDKLLNRAWHWYKSYMQWEDNNIDLEDYAQDN